MGLKLEQCTSPADFARAFEIASSSFGHRHPYINVVFPDHAGKQGRVVGGQRFKAYDEGDKYTTFYKATDEATGKVVGMSKWNVYDDGVIPEEVELDGPYWDDGKGDKGWAKEIFWQYLVPRRKAIRESGGYLVSLDLMAIDPDEQRRGAGQLLMTPGIEAADRLGLESVVEASDEGRGLYEKFGFKSLETVSLELPEPYKDRPVQVFHWMVRPKNS